MEKYLWFMSVPKWNSKKYHTVGTFPKSNRQIAERGEIDTPNAQMHDHSLSWKLHRAKHDTTAACRQGKIEQAFI